MKKTKILVMTAVIVLGLGSAVYAKLPKNSIMIGNTVYNSGYLNNSSHLSDINDQLMNNLGNIYYIDDTGKAQDIFTGSPVDDSQIVAKVGSTLTYYTATGTKQKIVADSNNQYADPNNATTNMFAIVNVTYKNITTGLSMYTVKASVSGVSNASYFKVGDSAITPLTDTATFMGNSLSGTGISFTVYASDGLTELAEGYINLTQSSSSGSLNTSIILNPTPNVNPDDDTTHGNTAINIANNGFATIDKSGKWIYYENTADSNKLYRKSVTGVDDYVISDDSVEFINVVGDWVYYSNYKENGKIYKVRTDGTQRQKVSDDMASCINVLGSKIYYINNSDRGRIYVIDSQGRRQFISDSAKYLSVGDNFLFYVNASDGNKPYSYNLLSTSSKTKLSNINTEFISASNDYLVFYTGKDGKLYRSQGGSTFNNNPMPLEIVTNIPQKGKGSALKGVTDKATRICGVDDNNIYYTSYADGRKVYKLDSTGNGYKVVDDSADYINVVGDLLYYMKAGKVSSVSKDSDGSTKGTAVTKPKLNEKVVSINALPTYSTDDITKFNFPDKVYAIMSDGSQRELVVNWDKTNPKITKGSYNFTGTILGYGTKVTMTVALDSGTIDISNVTVVNEVGSKDSVTVNGVNTKLNPGDVISVYANMSDTKPLKTATVDSNYKAVISGLNLDPNGTTVYVTVTAKGKAEGSKVGVPCPAEAPVGFAVNAQDQKITGLKPGKSYKVYINDENADGTIPGLPTDYITDIATDKGEITVNNIHDKITGPDGKGNKKQMLRVVLAGNVDSKPSTPVEISKAVVPENISIDLNYGKIIGYVAGMQYRYYTDDWKDCQSGSTSISMTMSLQVQIKVKASGPLMESDPVTYGLFPIPQVTGIETGKIYASSTFPNVAWNTDTASIKYTATLSKDGGSAVSVTDGNDLKSKTTANGNYVFTVTGTKTDPNMTPSIATNSKEIKFTVNSAQPPVVDISMVEKAGTKKTNTSDPDTYYTATPSWTNLAGTYSEATLKMTKTASGTPGSVTYTNVANPATVAFVPGNTVEQNGEYELAVTTTSKENGAVTKTVKTFRVDSIDKAVAPNVTGVFNGGTYRTKVTPVIDDKANCTTKPTISLNGAVTPYETTSVSNGDGTTTQTGKELTVNGSYSLILDTTNDINGHTNHSTVSFTMLDTSSGSDAPVNIAITNNASGDDKVVVGNASTEKIPYGSIIKVYSASGSLIGTATNNDVAGPVTVTITGGFPVNDTNVYVTRTDLGKQESNKTPVALTLVPNIKSVSPTTFTETSADDGTISGLNSDGTETKKVVVEIQNGKIKDGIAVTDVTSENLPTGLSYTLQKLDDTHLGIVFGGAADNRDLKNSISNLTFTIKASGLTDTAGNALTDSSFTVKTTPITINFNTAPKAVDISTIKATDIGNANNGSDLQVVFDKSQDETADSTNKVASYRIIVVKSSKSLDSVEAANAVTNYTTAPCKNGTSTIKLDASAKDSDGEAIKNGDYKVYVLSVANGSNANVNSLSGPVNVTLNAAAIAPTVTSAVATNANTIKLTMSSALTGASADAGAFSITGVTSNPGVTGVAVSGTTVTLTLDNAITSADTPKISYTAQGTANDLTNGTKVVNFANQVVTNNVAPTFVSAVTTTSNIIQITMSSTLTAGNGDKGAFTISGSSLNAKVNMVSVSGSIVTLTLDNSIKNGESIQVSYNPTGTNNLTNGTTPVASFIGKTVTNTVAP